VLTRQEKETEVQELNEKFSRATSVFLADYRGLDVKATDELRQKLREGAGDDEPFEYHVGKNSLLRRAVEGSDASPLAEHLSGPTAYAISYGDPVSLARVLVEYANKSDDFELKGAVVEGRAFGADEVAVVATLPTLLEARAMLVGLLQAPATKLVRLLGEPGGQLARLVKAREESLGEGES
jgi:large subunit ribosomal protein L10